MFWHRVRNTLPQIVAICSLHQVQDVLLCPRQTPTRHLFLMRNSAECWILNILDCPQHLYIFIILCRLGILMGKYRMKNKGSADHLYLLSLAESWAFFHFQPLMTLSFSLTFHARRKPAADCGNHEACSAFLSMRMYAFEECEGIWSNLHGHHLTSQSLERTVQSLSATFLGPTFASIVNPFPKLINLLGTCSKLFCHETVPDFLILSHVPGFIHFQSVFHFSNDQQ